MTEYRHNVKEIKASSEGLWLQILPALDGRFSDAASKPGEHVPCPVHSNSRDGFRLFGDGGVHGMGLCNSCHGAKPLDGFGLLQWANGWSFTETIGAVAEYLKSGTADIDNRVTAISHQSKTDALSKHKAGIKKQWEGASREPHSAAVRYFQRRGVSPLPSASIRYHGGIPYHLSKHGSMKKPSGSWYTWPAILCQVRVGDTPVGIHQTYLTSDGLKASAELHETASSLHGGEIAAELECKKFWNYAPLSGSAIWLGRCAEEIIVCEGLETGLAVAQLTGGHVPIACTTTAPLMGSLVVPNCVKHVRIYADKDTTQAGEIAANKLRERLENSGEMLRKVDILMPEMDISAGSKGVDWLDYLNRK